MYIDSDVLIDGISSTLKGEVDVKLICECIKAITKIKGIEVPPRVKM